LKVWSKTNFGLSQVKFGLDFGLRTKFGLRPKISWTRQLHYSGLRPKSETLV